MFLLDPAHRQDRSRTASTRVPHREPPAVHRALSSPGQVLDAGTRSDMEARFGHDFGRVRVHLGEEADAAARDVDARAFAFGEHLVFAAGQYTPETAGGQGLLAHELTHVLQQRTGAPARVQRDSDEPEATQPKTPLNLVFHQGDSSASPSFKAYATSLANNLAAPLLPFTCKAGSGDSGKTGSISCSHGESALNRAAKYAQCLDRLIAQLHVVGHVPSDGPVCLSGSMTAALAKWYLPDAKIVVHGCQGLARYSRGTASIHKHLPEASVYVHKASAEAGGPLDFYKVTLDASGATPKQASTKVRSATAEEIGFTQESVKKWAESHLANVKRIAAKTKKSSDDQASLKNITGWFRNPLFYSQELEVFADLLLQDANVPDTLKNAAREFKKKWNADQPAESP